MADPAVTIPMQIRRVIFEKYNDPDNRFTNDDVFAVLQKGGTIDKSLTIDDMGAHFDVLCNSGMMRNIAQNFTTQWFKLFDPLEEIKCTSCDFQNILSKSEDRACLYCKKPIST